MSIEFNFPRIDMELYETDIPELQKFIATEKVEGEFTEEYLILYDFAIDCKYSECIQQDLIKYLLPFYFKVIEQAVIYGNKIAIDIYYQFNLAIFFNQINFKNAVGEKNYQNIMKYYIQQTIRAMEIESFGMLGWVSIFNTTIAFYDANIRWLFKKIFCGSIKIKYIFFQYLSVLLFKESDNLLAVNEAREFWTSGIWDFDDGYFRKKFFWNKDVVVFFDKEINRERIEELFEEVKPLISDTIGAELVDIFYEEMEQSFRRGVFSERKAEYLKKISCKSRDAVYWDTTF